MELKGKEPFNIKNYCSYILTSNNPNVVNASDKDRRFCVLPCVNKKIDDKMYFDEYERTINENPEAIRCIYEYLKRFDIKKVIPNMLFGEARPKSDLYLELQECNREKEWDFLEKVVETHRHLKLNKIEIPMEELWDSFKSFCTSNNYDISRFPSKRFHYNFSQQIIQYLDNKDEFVNSITKSRTSTKRMYVLDMEKLKKFFKMELQFVDDEN